MRFRINLTRIISCVVPPVISQKMRDFIFPIHLARKYDKTFKKKSITGSYLIGNTSDYHGYRFYIHGFFEWRNIIIARAVKKIRKGDIIEIGANVGTETVSFADLVNKKDEFVHAFEPLPSNIHYLNKLVGKHKQIKLYPFAISNKNGDAKFIIPPKNSSGTGSILLSDESDKNSYHIVKTVRLDDLIKDFNKPSLLFADTEGHEPLILKGAEGFIEKFKPIIILEASPQLLAKNSGYNLKFILDFFKKNDYNVYKINRLTISDINDTDLNTKKSANWVCIPSKDYRILKQIKL